MEERFPFSGPIGHYGELPVVKCESVAEAERCGFSDGMKTECDRIQYERPESGPDLIMKVEPEEDVSRWGPPLPRDRILLSRTEPGASSGILAYVAPSNRFMADRRRRHPGTVLSRPTRGETARFLERERLRNVKFSDRENNVLVRKISENYEKILGRLITGTSAAEKKEIWRDIVAAVNSVSHHTRTVAQCKKRYSDIKKKVKEKLAKQRGGKQVNVFFWPYEKHMLSLMSSKMALSLNEEVDSPAMSEEEDSAHTLTPCEALPIRRSLNDGGLKADSTPGKEDMAEETSLASTEKYDLFSDQDSQENGDISEAQCDSQQSSSVPSQSDPDPNQSDTTLERSLRHLSACVKAQTATLRQTNVILRNLSTNMHNGFQQLVHIIQQVASSIPRPDSQPGTAGQSSTLPTSMPASGHIGRGRPGRGRGRRPHSASNPARKSRGKSRDAY
ncbi:uncharacterized protein LOC120935810 isoform X2 [Rana temporaria]|nr:uncharacterized protein LOC120935810 isoform X2 [Rana temporaria]